MNKSIRRYSTPENYASAAHGLIRVFIRDLALEMSLGIYPHEKASLQPVLFNIDLAVAEFGTQVPQNIDDVVCYEKVVTGIKALIKDTHFDLIETLAEKIAENCLKNNRVVCVRVKIEKTTAIEQAAGVGVEIERFSLA